jgi:xanthine/uracil permease
MWVMQHFKRRHLLLFGPLSTFITCIGIFLDSLYWQPSGPQTISDVSQASWPAPIIFAISLSIIAITLAIFCMSLDKYWPYAFRASIFGGVCLAIAGWIQYLFKGRVPSFIHGLCIVLVVIVYELIIWQIGRRGPGEVKKLNKVLFYLIIVASVLTLISINLIHRYITIFELASFILLQVWIVGTALILEKNEDKG